MRDRTRKISKTVDTTVLHTEPMIVEGFDLHLNRNVLFMERREQVTFYVPVYANAPATLLKSQPKEVKEEYMALENSTVVGCEFFNKYKHLMITLGSNKKDPLCEWEYDHFKVHIYKLIAYRYDRQDNEMFYEIEIQNKEKDTFYISFEDIPVNEHQHLEYIKKFFLKLYNIRDNAQKLRHLFYRVHTQNKSNSYRGYTRVSDIPDTQRITRQKLAQLATHITKKGTLAYGENGLGIFIGWLSYWNEYKATNDLSAELLSRERHNFNDIFSQISTFMKKQP